MNPLTFFHRMLARIAPHDGAPTTGARFLASAVRGRHQQLCAQMQKKHTQMHESAKAQLQLGDCKYNRIYISRGKRRLLGIDVLG